MSSDSSVLFQDRLRKKGSQRRSLHVYRTLENEISEGITGNTQKTRFQLIFVRSGQVEKLRLGPVLGLASGERSI